MVAVPLNSNFKTLIASLATFVFISIGILLFLYNPPATLAPHHFVEPGYGLLRPIFSVAKPKYAIATFLSHDSGQDWDRSDVQNDQGFIGTRMLIYQLLYANETRLRDANIQFLVLCTPTVSPAKRQQLILDGATIVNVDTPPLPQYLLQNGKAVALDHFSKLRLFALTQYDRILYLAPQMFLQKPVDPVFEDTALHNPSETLSSTRPKEVKQDEAPLPANYLFAARSDANAANNHDPYAHEYPPALTNSFSPFALLLAPSLELYALLLSALHSPRLESVFSNFYRNRYRGQLARWRQNTGPESALLNYVFRRDGTMPWSELDPRWSANWGNSQDMDEMVVGLQGEYWWSGPLDVRDRWVEWKGRMEAEFA